MGEERMAVERLVVESDSSAGMFVVFFVLCGVLLSLIVLVSDVQMNECCVVSLSWAISDDLHARTTFLADHRSSFSKRVGKARKSLSLPHKGFLYLNKLRVSARHHLKAVGLCVAVYLSNFTCCHCSSVQQQCAGDQSKHHMIIKSFLNASQLIGFPRAATAFHKLSAFAHRPISSAIGPCLLLKSFI